MSGLPPFLGCRLRLSLTPGLSAAGFRRTPCRLLMIPPVKVPVRLLLVLLVGWQTRTVLVLESKPILCLLQWFTVTMATLVGVALMLNVVTRRCMV